jgi:hypothetical protein
MKRMALALVLAAAASVQAQVVGSFDDTRVANPTWNLMTGSAISMMRECFESRGALITTTPTLTPEYLATVDVFFTSYFTKVVPTQAEADAMVAWVQAGGTFVVTGDCG